MGSSDVTTIGITNYRSTHKVFGIKDRDRLSHIYVLGKSGTGKSTFLENLAISDMRRGNGIFVLDPHGDVATNLIKFVPAARINDLIYLDATDNKNALAFNPLLRIPAKFHSLVASGVITTFKKVWSDSWGPRMEYILRYALLTLLAVQDATLLDVQPLLTDKEFRNSILIKVGDTEILAFWSREFDKYTPALRAEAVAPILNKLGLFSTSPALRSIVGQKTSSFRFGTIINTSKILIVNLSKGIIGEDAASLLGAMLVTGVQLAALNRASIPEENRKPFYVYIDECHSFITLSFTTILAEGRKYGISLFLAHQYIEQLDERICSAIFGNVGTLISFRVGAVDAEKLALEYYPVFTQDDFINLPRYSVYLKLMIDGTVSVPFSARTILNH